MKKMLLFISSIVFINNINAQDYQNLFFNEGGELCSKQEAVYHRQIKLLIPGFFYHGPFRDYSTDSTLLAQGSYKRDRKEGSFELFYANGNRKAQGDFKEDQMTGTWAFYYEDGSLWQKIRFKSNGFEIIEYLDAEGKNLIQETFVWKKVYDDLDDYVEGKVVLGSKEGKWKMIMSGNLVAYENYKNGVLKKSYNSFLEERTNKNVINNDILVPPYLTMLERKALHQSVSYEEYTFIWDGEKYSEISAYGMLGDSLVTEIDKGPSFPGGLSGLYATITMDIQSPMNESGQIQEGKVLVEFTVSSSGTIKDIRIVESTNRYLNNEVMRLIGQLGGWKPAEHNGKAINSQLKIPINFRPGG